MMARWKRLKSVPMNRTPKSSARRIRMKRFLRNCGVKIPYHGEVQTKQLEAVYRRENRKIEKARGVKPRKKRRKARKSRDWMGRETRGVLAKSVKTGMRKFNKRLRSMK